MPRRTSARANGTELARFDSEDATVGIGGDRKVQLVEDACHVLLDPTVGQEHARSDRRMPNLRHTCPCPASSAADRRDPKYEGRIR